MTLWKALRTALAAPGPEAAVDIAADGVTAAWPGGAAGAPGCCRAALPPGALAPTPVASNVRDPETVAAALRTACASLPRRATRVALAVPDAAAVVSLQRLDDVPSRRRDLERLLRWKLVDVLPFRLDAAQFAWAAAGPGQSARTFVVAALRRDVVEEYEALATAVGLQPGLVAPATFGVLSLALAAAPQAAGDRLLVHAAAGCNTAALLRGDALELFSSQPGETPGDLEELVHRTVLYSEDRLDGAGIREVLLATARSGAEDVAARLRERVELPVRMLTARGGAPPAAAGLLPGTAQRAA